MRVAHRASENLAVATAPLTLITGIAASSAQLLAVAIAETQSEEDVPRGDARGSRPRSVWAR
jgi:hypothetical protein